MADRTEPSKAPVDMLTARLKMSRIGVPLLLVVTGTILGWEVSGSAPGDHLASLEVPPQLRVTVVHHLARHFVDEGVDAFSDCQTGRCRAEHIVALARHAALYDRPRLDEEERRPPRGQRSIDGEPFPDGRAWIVRDRDRAWGKPAAIDGLIRAAQTVMADYPGGQPLFVADMSLPEGGPMPPHRSHQSGRDVDVSYYTRDGTAPQVRHVSPEDLDEKRTWTFLRTLLTQAKPEMIFMSAPLQVRLYEYAESIGEHPAWLARVFELGPREHSNRWAVVRLAPGHTTHMHIRFACGDADGRCDDE